MAPRVALLAVVFVCSLVASIHASKCQDAIIQNLGARPAEAKSLCSACLAVLPGTQCTTCFQSAKTLMDAAQCPKAMSARKLLQGIDDPEIGLLSPPPPSPQGVGMIIIIGGGNYKNPPPSPQGVGK